MYPVSDNSGLPKDGFYNRDRFPSYSREKCQTTPQIAYCQPAQFNTYLALRVNFEGQILFTQAEVFFYLKTPFEGCQGHLLIPPVLSEIKNL